MSRYSNTKNYLNSSDDEDPLLAGQINTVMDYRNELAGKQPNSKFTPHSAEYYLTHDFSDEINQRTSTTTTGASNTTRTTSRITSGNPYLDDNFVEAQLVASGINPNSFERRSASATTTPFKGSTPWHLPNPQDEDLALAGEINTIVDLREELQVKQGAARGNRFANYQNNSVSNASPEIRRTSVGNPRLNSSYYDQNDYNQPTRTSRGNPRLNPSNYDDIESRQVRRTSTGDPRLNSSNFYEEQNTIRRTSNEDPRLHPSYMLDDEQSQVRRTSTGNPRLNPSYMLDDEPSQVRRTSTGNPRLNPSYMLEDEPSQIRRTSNVDPRLQQSYFDADPEPQVRRTSTGNPRLNASYFDNANERYDESEDDNGSIPWHTPDPDMEDQCLAGQMNVLVDYRNELEAKKGRASGRRSVGFSQPVSPRNSYSNYEQNSGYARNGGGYDEEIDSFDAAADYRTSRRPALSRGQTAFSDDDTDRETVPWHLPDEGEEDLCLASQINTIIDYRNELKEKQGRNTRGKPLMSQQLMTGAASDLNSSYDLAAGPSRGARGYPPQVESVPWHLPDEGEEDLCLASQINTIIDYRNELKAKNAALNPQKRRAQQGPLPYSRNAPSTFQRPAPVPRPAPAQKAAPKVQQRQAAPQTAQTTQKSGISFRSTTTSASSYRPAPQQQQKLSGYPSTKPQTSILQSQPQPKPQPQPTSSYLSTSQRPQRQYASYQNESQFGYKYTTNKDNDDSSDEEVSLEEYDASSGSLTEDERIGERNYASANKKSDANRLHKALAHLDNASRLLDSV